MSSVRLYQKTLQEFLCRTNRMAIHKMIYEFQCSFKSYKFRARPIGVDPDKLNLGNYYLGGTRLQHM